MTLTFNPFTRAFDFEGSGGGTTSADNFSYTKISTGDFEIIPAGQQMIVFGHIVVDGHLSVLGEMIVTQPVVQEQFFYSTIRSGNTVEVNDDRVLFYRGHLDVLGMIRVSGQVEPI